jgi:hypothetical protein
MDKLASASDVLPCCNASLEAFILFFISFICSGAIVTSPTSSPYVVVVMSLTISKNPFIEVISAEYNS